MDLWLNRDSLAESIIASNNGVAVKVIVSVDNLNTQYCMTLKYGLNIGLSIHQDYPDSDKNSDFGAKSFMPVLIDFFAKMLHPKI